MGQAEAAKRALHCCDRAGEPLPPREPSGAHLIAARRSLAAVRPCSSGMTDVMGQSGIWTMCGEFFAMLKHPKA